MSRSEERQRMKEEDYSSLHRGRESASRSPSRSRSRSRSRGRKSRRDPRRQKSRSRSPTDSKSSKSLSRSDSRWESPSNTPPNTTKDINLNPVTLKQELQALQSIPTTALSTAEAQTQPIAHQSIAAIVDSVLPQHPPLHQQPPQQTQQPQVPTQPIQPPQVTQQPEVQPPPQHIQYNIDEGTLRKFCQPYNMEELVRMICNTACVSKDFYDILVNEMKRSSKWCKLFVHGLPWTTTQETLYNVFSRFGQIQECVILKDRNGQSKGYGFINYTNATEAMNAINAGPQQIDGRMVGSDLAWKGRKNRGSGGSTHNNNNNTNNHGGGNRSYPMSHGHRAVGAGNPLQARIVNTASNGLGGPLAMRRLFVYSLLYTTNDETLHSVFSQFGELEEAVIIKDKTNDMKSKGYGFVIYKNVRDAQKALQQPHKMIDGRTVHCSLAIDGQNKHGGNNDHQHGGHATHGAGMAAAAHHGVPGAGGSGLSALSGLIAQQQAQLAAHPTLNALNTILQAQQQQAALQSYADPYQNVLYQAALGGGAPNAASGGAGAGTTQLLQQLLAQQQQLLQSQANGEDAKKSAPAPINPNGY